MDKTGDTLRQVFNWLYREQQSSWFPQYQNPRRLIPTARAKEVWEHLVNFCTPVTEIELNHWFPTKAEDLDVDFSSKNLFLYLPPLEKDGGFVPVLSLRCRLSTESIVMKLRVMLVCLAEDDQNPGAKELRALKLRLEAPHGDEYGDEENEEREDELEGRHDFYHGQLVRVFRDFRGRAYVKSPNWLPESQPSFPLTADCPVTLMLCLLLTLYGKRQSLELLKRNANLWKWLTSYMSTLQPWIKWKELEDTFA